jgi:hypothetical protein
VIAKKSAISRYLAKIGRKGGKATGRKGLAVMEKSRVKEIARQGAAARWRKK